MVNKLRILSAILLAAIYCHTAIAVKKPIVHSQVINHETSSQETLLAEFSLDQFFHTSKTEQSVNQINNLPAPDVKNPSAGFWAIFNATERQIVREYSQYSRYAGNFLINYRKANLIFPFHYFW
ncbi:MAG: hypothetical protein LWX09_02390 [Bacteroidia bacterium]|nr:hypothetical protein [Bacteroidia bacterium]